ncbi:MAG: hypothetical protein N2Z21_10675, partial [Candidatus Sumerlaeaceae bacterium]|nr:hypothetical protein [Candidatus Sumerlaeaceae bacterium]
VDGEETVTLPAGTLGWHFEVHLPEVSGEVWLKSEDKLGETTALVGLVQPPSAPLNLWRHQLRHFLDPRVNGLEVLERWAHLERLTTATVAKYELPTGHRTFVFDPSGVLREKRAGGCRPDGTAVEGLLRFDDIADAPFFPRHIVHERTDTAMPGKEITRWEITHVEEIRSLEELKKLINQWDCKSAPQVSGLSASSANTSGDSLTTDAMF